MVLKAAAVHSNGLHVVVGAEEEVHWYTLEREVPAQVHRDKLISDEVPSRAAEDEDSQRLRGRGQRQRLGGGRRLRLRREDSGNEVGGVRGEVGHDEKDDNEGEGDSD